jgi:DNA segregation ATPase FtsK/SpoIIIE, S-DNA-T family
MSHPTPLGPILNAFRIKASCQNTQEYKNAVCYDLVLSPGARLRDIEKYATELSLALKSPSRPRIFPLTEEGVVRLEFLKPRNAQVDLFGFSDLARPEGKQMLLLGETLEGSPLWFDLMTNPHLLVAGATGSGKSTLLHSIIANLLSNPNTFSFLMDPKNIEFFKYAELPNAPIRVSYDYNECLMILEWLCQEMDNRYRLLREQQLTADQLSSLVLVIDEYADLVGQDESKRFRSLICRLAQKSRAADIHIVLATQRPAANVVDGNIKANFSTRIACKVASKVDSRVVLDSSGAEILAGRGDAILNGNAFSMQRFQAAYTTPDQVVSYFTGNGI